jgi:hypothetical protein
MQKHHCCGSSGALLKMPRERVVQSIGVRFTDVTTRPLHPTQAPATAAAEFALSRRPLGELAGTVVAIAAAAKLEHTRPA